MMLVSNGDIQRSKRTCSQEQHAQAQHWLLHAQAQLMHAQHWPRTQSRSRQGGGCPPLPCSHLGPRPMLSMHELSLPEPMLSLSILILATCPGHAQECSEHCSERSARSERSERSWTPGTTFGANTGIGPGRFRRDPFGTGLRLLGTRSILCKRGVALENHCLDFKTHVACRVPAGCFRYMMVDFNEQSFELSEVERL